MYSKLIWMNTAGTDRYRSSNQVFVDNPLPQSWLQ